jgi:hypothetical protein
MTSNNGTLALLCWCDLRLPATVKMSQSLCVDRNIGAFCLLASTDRGVLVTSQPCLARPRTTARDDGYIELVQRGVAHQTKSMEQTNLV